MFNPEITAQSGSHTATEEGLSLSGSHSALRQPHIRVRLQTLLFSIKTLDSEGTETQIVRHEIDPCNGMSM
jgi:peptide deformylase